MKRFNIISIIICSVFIYSCGGSGGPGAKANAGSGTPIVIPEVSSGAMTVDGSINDWDGAGIPPLSGLKWTASFSKPAKADSLRIKEIRLACDGSYVYLLMKVDPGVGETNRTGHLGYIYVDSDGSATTGQYRDASDEYSGWDYRIYLPTGFFGGLGKTTKSMISYKVEKITRGAREKVKYGYKFSADYDDVPGGEKSSQKDHSDIAFSGKYVEMRIPKSVLGISAPTQVNLAIKDLSAFPDAETTVKLSLE